MRLFLTIAGGGREQCPMVQALERIELRKGYFRFGYGSRAVEIHPRSWPAHLMLGKGYKTLDDHARAYEAFREAARLCPEHADVQRELSLECLHRGKFGEAVTAARRVVQARWGCKRTWPSPCS